MTSTPDENAGAAGSADVAELESEVATLRSQLDTRERRHRRMLTLRTIVAAVLVALAALGVTGSVIGVWSARTTLNTDKFVSTLKPLQSDPAVQTALSTYLATQIYTSLDVPTRLKEALPGPSKFLAGPLSGQVENYLGQGVSKVVASPQFAVLWPAILRFAHEKIMAVINNDSSVVQTSGDVVTLDLLPIVNEALKLLQTQIPTLFGHTITLPTITNGEIPANLRDQIDSALGITLPANFAQVPIYRAHELSTVQTAVKDAKKYVALLVIVSLVMVGLAYLISPQRRRTTVQLGLWLVIWVVLLRAVIRAVHDQIINGVAEGVYRDGAASASHVIFATLRTRGTQLIWIGAIMAVVAYLFGPGRGAVFVRSWVVRGMKAATDATRRGASGAAPKAPVFARTYKDPLRIGGLVVGVFLVLIFPTWTGLLWTAIVIGAYELAVTLLAGAGSDSGGPRGEIAQPLTG